MGFNNNIFVSHRYLQSGTYIAFETCMSCIRVNIRVATDANLFMTLGLEICSILLFRRVVNFFRHNFHVRNHPMSSPLLY